VALALIFGMILFAMTFVYMIIWVVIGVIYMMFALLAIFGGLAMKGGHWRAGAVMCGIAGIITLPIGLLGLGAAVLAWMVADEDARFGVGPRPLTGGPVQTSSRVIEERIDR
jgi:hypothetical protein